MTRWEAVFSARAHETTVVMWENAPSPWRGRPGQKTWLSEMVRWGFQVVKRATFGLEA